MSRSSRVAFSLLELTVAAALMAVVTGVLISFVISAYRAVVRSSRQSDVQRNAMAVVHRLQEDIRCAHPESLRVIGGQLSLLSHVNKRGVTEYSPLGKTLWRRWETFYLDQRQIRLREVEVPGLDPPALTPPVLGAPQPSDRTIAWLIERFECVVKGPMLQLVVETKDEAHRTFLSTTLAVPTSGD